MLKCPACGHENPADSRTCEGCALPLRAGATDATVRWKPPEKVAAAASRRAIGLATLFSQSNRVLVGRSPECGVYLPHPTVSRLHVELQRAPDGLLLRDLESVNGVLVNGHRVRDAVVVHNEDRVGVGPYLFHLEGEQLIVLDSSRSLRLEARGLEKIVLDAQGQQRKLLDNINLAIEPGEFVSLLGPSGSGKSTLMDCLNGRRPATGGAVLANGENFYVHFDSFRQSLGYVPQRDIVHTQLTVQGALSYTARLRLPLDTDSAELTSRIEEVIRLMELEPHRHTLIGQLSGGQIKRVSLGAELLARPCLLYIDEATSGLDAGTEARMMRMFRHLADEGKSIVCITHNVDNVDLCNLIIVLMRGRLVYLGPPAEARQYFQVERISGIYDQLAQREAAAWEEQFQKSEFHQEFVEKRQQVTGRQEQWEELDRLQALNQQSTVFNPLARLLPAAEKARGEGFRLWHQFRILTARYLEMLYRDRSSLRLLFLQAPIVAIFILLGFAHKPYDEKTLAPRKPEEWERRFLARVGDQAQRIYDAEKDSITKHDTDGKAKEFYEMLQALPKMTGPVIPYRVIVNPRYTYTLLFLVVLIVLWFGCNNASKEIVKEEPIYARERAVNLGIIPYLGSKFLVLGVLTAVQTLVLMLCIYGVMYLLHLSLGWAMPWPAYHLDYLPQYGVLVLLGLTGVALGLLLSACVNSPDRANALLPYVLIPQIILGGGILAVREGPLYWVAIVLSPSYWAYRAVRLGTTALPPDLPQAMTYDESVWWPCLVLVIQATVLLLLTGWFLRQRDIRPTR